MPLDNKDTELLRSLSGPEQSFQHLLPQLALINKLKEYVASLKPLELSYCYLAF